MMSLWNKGGNMEGGKKYAQQFKLRISLRILQDKNDKKIDAVTQQTEKGKEAKS